ncbi:hypothetical protein NHX12_026183, partial [Muraenolepis orangiensis]
TEERIKQMECEATAGDVDGYKQQIEQHKELQNDLEAEQVKVNSLTHMVVVVDENSGESATAALEDQLQSLGERWAAVCRWTEERWHKLQEVLLVWQQLLEDQSFFSAWLTEKEQALGDVKTSGFKDQSEMNANVRRLATLKEDMEMKRRTLDQLSDAGQDVVSLLRSPAAGAKIEETTEDLTLRWDNLVMEAVASSGMTEVEQECVVDTVAMAAAAASSKSSSFIDQDSAQPAKKRMMETDVEDRMELEGNLSALLSWMTTWRSSAQTLACTHPGAACDAASDLHSDLKSLQLQLASKEDLIGQVTREGRRLVDQLEREGVSADTLRSDVDLLQTQQDACSRELQAARERVRVQSRLGELGEALANIDGAVGEHDRWLQTTQADGRTTPDQDRLGDLHAECLARLAQLTELGPQLEQLSTEAGSLGSTPALRDAAVVVSAHRSSTLQQLRGREQELDQGIQALLRQAEVDPVEALEDRLGTLKEGVADIPSTQDAVERAQALCIEIEQTQKASDPAELQRWSKLSSRARDELSTLQCILGSLKDNQVRSVEVERWLDAVQELMSQDATKQSEAERLQDELNQCKEYVNEMESVESSLKQMRENVCAVQGAAVPGLTNWGQDNLDQCQARWDELSKPLLRVQERTTERQERQANLRKDLAEMQEWMAQVDEEFLMRDFEYKNPQELEAALDEMKRAKEDVLQKEVRVKILKDNINALVNKTSPPAGGAGQELTSELDGVLANYHKLCERFKSKCHTLEEVWSCWMELLQYLEMEHSWLGTLEAKLQTTEDLPESTDAVNKALEIRELGQTLIDGGILDELISEKLDAFNSRYDQLSQQAGSRQLGLEQQSQALQDNEQALQELQEALGQLDHTLTSYLTDQITAHEATVEDMKRRNVANMPPAPVDGKAARGGTMLDQLQYQLFQKPANFEQRMLDCKRVLDGAQAELHVLDAPDTDPDTIQKLYKLLSEVKLEVETVIKTGRQIVQKQQTENPKAMDEQLTALKMLYNDLGAQVTEGKQELEKALSLSQKFHKESAALEAWLTSHETQLQQKNGSGDMPAEIDAEVAWANGLLKETERRKAELGVLTETAGGLQALVEGSGAHLDQELCGLNQTWGRVRTWTEDWLSAVLSHQNEVEIFDENLAHISTWLYQTQIHLDEAESLPSADKERVVKRMLEELAELRLRVDSVREQAVILMTSRGPACRDVVEPKLAELNRNFDKVSQHIQTAQMMSSLESGSAVEMMMLQSSQQQQQIIQSQQSRVEVQSQTQVSSVGPSEVLHLQAQLQDSLRALQQQQEPTQLLDDDKLDEEKAGVEELLRRGEDVMQHASDDTQREELRLLLLRLQSQYSAQRERKALQVRQLDVSVDSSTFYSFTEHTSDMSVSPVERVAPGVPSASDYLLDINKVLLAMADSELLLNSQELSGGLYEDFSSQEDSLRNVKDGLDRLGERVADIHERQPDAIADASPGDVAQIGDALAQLNAEWDRLNRVYSHRKGGFDRAVEEWRQFHCDLKDLNQWLGDTEGVMAEGTGPDGQLDLDTAVLHQQELEEGLASHQADLAVLSRTGERIIGQLSAPDGPLLQDKLEVLGQRWRAVNRQVFERRRRLAGGDSTALAELVQRSGELSRWMQEAENAAAALPEAAATDENLQELKALVEDMDTQNESIAWLNKHGPKTLANPSVSPKERDLLVSKLRTINLGWSKVTRDLRAKAGEAESNLQGHTVFQERMNRLTDWVQVTRHTVSARGVSPVQAQALEASMRERKRDLEDLLARSIELQRRQQLLPQEKTKVEQLASDWKALDMQLRESLQQLVSSVLSTVHMAGLAAEGPRPQAPAHGVDAVAPTDLNATATELADWLLLITQMLKSNIVTVGDTDEIRATIRRLTSRTRPPIWTCARLSPRNHGVEARLRQLDNMIGHSDQWEEQRLEVASVIGQNEGRYHSMLQQSRESLTKQLTDNKLLREYSIDDTRRIKEVADKHNAAWNAINNRASDRQAQLDCELKGLQGSLRELEAFLKWLQEAETTVNVLADASQREELSQDSAHLKELRAQLEPPGGTSEGSPSMWRRSGRRLLQTPASRKMMAMVRTSLQKVVVFLHRLQRMAISSPRYQKLCKTEMGFELTLRFLPPDRVQGVGIGLFT